MELYYVSLKIRENKCASAFAPISHPTKTPWGQVAFEGYLGSIEAGKDYDAVELIQKYQGPKTPILVDQGTADIWLANELWTEELLKASIRADYPLELRMQPNYDHSYWFVSTFLEEHIQFHAKKLGL